MCIFYNSSSEETLHCNTGTVAQSLTVKTREKKWIRILFFGIWTGNKNNRPRLALK